MAGIHDYDPLHAVALHWPNQASLPKTLAWGDIDPHYLPPGPPEDVTRVCRDQLLLCARKGRWFRRSVRAAWRWQAWLQAVAAVLLGPGVAVAYMLGVRTSLLGTSLWVIEHDLSPLSQQLPT